MRSPKVTRTVLVSLALSALLAAALTAGLGVSTAKSPVAGPSAGFSPKLLAGSWTGTWTNTTFGSTGPLSLKIKAPQNKRLVATLDFGGDIFGCPDPPAEAMTLKKGSGANRWNAKGFKVARTSDSLGKTTLAYKYATKALSGGGADPKCRAGLKWKLVATKLKPKTLAGTVEITLPDGSTATATLSAKR